VGNRARRFCPHGQRRAGAVAHPTTLNGTPAAEMIGSRHGMDGYIVGGTALFAVLSYAQVMQEI